MSKLKVAILMGGPSSEHEVSVKSGLNVLKNLDHKKYEAIPVFINTAGYWLFEGKKEQPLTEPEGVLRLSRLGVDAVFIALHGEYGEDGTIQRELKLANLSFAGSKTLPSALAMNKTLSGKVLERAGFLIPKTCEIRKIDWRSRPQEVLKSIYNNFGNRIVVKPANRGSSVGVGVVNIIKGDLRPLESAIIGAFSVSKHVIAQEFIKGREVTCGVLDLGGKLEALMPTEIIPTGRPFFDFKAKYEGASKEITPPENMSFKLIKRIEDTAVSAHKILGLSGISRTDMIIGSSNKIYILELNTIPGFTETSLIPQQAKACGIEFAKLLDLLILDAVYPKSA